MSRRRDKRERAAYHDSGRYLKNHPPRRSDPLFGIKGKETWASEVTSAIKKYPERLKEREQDMKYGAYRTGRRGISAENVALRHSGGSVVATEAALKQFPSPERKRLQAILWGNEEYTRKDRELVGRFKRYLAVFLGYGRPRYNLKKG